MSTKQTDFLDDELEFKDSVDKFFSKCLEHGIDEPLDKIQLVVDEVNESYGL